MGDPLARRNALFLLKGATKMRKTAIADFESGFRDVAAAGGDEGGGAVDAGAADPEHERGAGDLGEGAAEVVGAATDGGGEGIELVGLVEVLEEVGFDTLYAVVSGAFGAGDELAAVGGRIGVGGKKLAEQEVREACFVQHEAGGFAEVGGHEAARPGEVLLSEWAAEAEDRGEGLADQGARGLGELRQQIAEVVTQPCVGEDQGEALVAVAGGAAQGGAGAA